MIKDLKIANVASYNADGVYINGLKKIDFFYGANGCGKTTISNYLANNNEPQFENCSISWEGNRPLKTLVYNKQFRDANFGTGAIAGVFTLGQATTEEIEQINRKKKELSDLRAEQISQQTTLKAQEGKLKDHTNNFTNECWSVYKQYEDQFKDALYGHINSKAKFKEKILSDHASNSSSVLSVDELTKKACTLLGSRPIRIDEIPTIAAQKSITSIEQSTIWQKVIIGKTDVDIAGLIGKLGNSDWVNQGRQYILDTTCPFCQKPTIDELFRAQLEEYFDESFENDKADLTAKLTSYNNFSSQLLSTLDQILISEKSKKETKLDIEKLSVHLKTLHSQISENKLLIQKKLDETSQQISLTNTQEEIEAISAVIKSANENIRGHNLLVENYDQEVASLKSEIWRFLVDILAERINTFKTQGSGLQHGITNISNQIKTRAQKILELDREIIELSKNVTSVQPAVDEINRLLLAYDFTNFRIVPSEKQENYYAIQRENGEFAHHTLSEGEVTFITFLYFVQLTKGALDENAVTEDRVLVIDDPISSLDSNILYVVSTITKELIRGIKQGSSNTKQLLLLTHNVYFHKEASFINSRSNGDSDTSFWIIRKNQNISSIQAYNQNNPIESSYELLWREIKEWQHNSGITLQNAMRRVIENYFKILGKFTDEGLVERFDTHEEQQICRSLISWINDGSHTIPDDLYIQTPDDSAEKYLSVFENIFKHTDNHGHYLMMMEKNNA